MSLLNPNTSELSSPTPTTDSSLLKRIEPESSLKTGFKLLRQSIYSNGSFDKMYSDEDLSTVFRFGFFLFSAILARGLLRLCTLSGSQTSGMVKFLNYVITMLVYILNVFYFVFVLYCLMTFLNLSSDALFRFPYGVVMVTCYTIIGCIEFCEKALFVVLVILSIPYYIAQITSDPKDFFIKFGISEVR